jgi:hypothetical protein
MMIFMHHTFVAATSRSPSNQPEWAIAAHCLVGGQGESSEREDFRRIGDPAIIGVLGDAQQGLETDVIQRQLPPFGQLGKLITQTEEAGAFERSAGGKRERDGLKLRRQIDAAAVFAQSSQIGDCVGTQLVDRSPLKIRPSRVGELTIVEGWRSFPFSLRAERVIENPGHFIGETILERASSSPDGKR